MLRKLTILAAVLAMLLTASTPLLAQQVGVPYDEVAVPLTDPSVPPEPICQSPASAGGCPPFVSPVPDNTSGSGMDNANAGSLQYGSELPPGAYYDCPPPTQPPMGRPCFLVVP